MIDWKAKFSSRKLWLAIVGLVTGLLLLFGVDKGTTDQIGGIVLTAGSIVAYIIGEGWADAAGAHAVNSYIDGWEDNAEQMANEEGSQRVDTKPEE